MPQVPEYSEVWHVHCLYAPGDVERHVVWAIGSIAGNALKKPPQETRSGREQLRYVSPRYFG